MTMNPTPFSPTTSTADLRSRVERAAQSLRTNAVDAKALEEAALRLTSASNDGAALSQQLSAAVESIAASAEETSITTNKVLKSQQNSSDLTLEVLTGVEESGTALREVAASVA